MGMVKKKDGVSALDKLRRQKKITADLDAGRYVSGGAQESLVIALDGSASMLGDSKGVHRSGWGGEEYRRHRSSHHYKSKWDAAVEATKMLVERSSSSHVGMVVFDHTVLGDLPIGTSETDSGRWLDEMAPKSGTCFAIALYAALGLHDEAPTRPVKRIILLSDGYDGMHLGRAPYERSVRMCRDRKVIVDTVGFGDADEQKLSRLADETGGVYKHAKDAADLVRQFKQLEAGVRGLLSGGK